MLRRRWSFHRQPLSVRQSRRPQPLRLRLQRPHGQDGSKRTIAGVDNAAVLVAAFVAVGTVTAYEACDACQRGVEAAGNAVGDAASTTASAVAAAHEAVVGKIVDLAEKATGAMAAKEHSKGARPSTEEKHERGRREKGAINSVVKRVMTGVIRVVNVRPITKVLGLSRRNQIVAVARKRTMKIFLLSQIPENPRTRRSKLWKLRGTHAHETLTVL